MTAFWGSTISTMSDPREVLKRVDEHRMKKLMVAALEEIECEEQDDRVEAFRVEIHGKRADGAVD